MEEEDQGNVTGSLAGWKKVTFAEKGHTRDGGWGRCELVEGSCTGLSPFLPSLSLFHAWSVLGGHRRKQEDPNV